MYLAASGCYFRCGQRFFCGIMYRVLQLFFEETTLMLWDRTSYGTRWTSSYLKGGRLLQMTSYHHNIRSWNEHLIPNLRGRL